MHHILVIEDSPLVLKLLGHFFKQVPEFEPVFCASRAEAEIMLETSAESFFAVVADLNLPDAPRGEVIDVVLAHRRPCIVLTGSYDERRREELINKGVVDYILKESQHAYESVIRLLQRLASNRQVKVLVAEDSALSRHYMQRVLAPHLYRLEEAQDGHQALDRLEKETDIDLLILDHDMPGIQGFEIVKLLRQKMRRNDLLILGVSADPQGMLSARFIKHGADDFLRKPFCPEELHCRVMAMLERRDLMLALKRAALYDGLTSLYNRRAFLVEAERLITANLQSNQPHCVAVLDIDRFKNINDQLGHAGGDTALMAFSRLLCKHFPKDIAGRLGGEEFALVSVADQADLMQRLDAFRVACNSLSYLPEAPTLSFSAGVAPIQSGALEEALLQADQRLYRAKREGRGRTLMD